MGIRKNKQVSNDELTKIMGNITPSSNYTNAVVSVVFGRDNNDAWKYLIGKCEFYDEPIDSEEIFSDMAFIRKAINDFDLKTFLTDLAGSGYVISKKLPPIKKSEGGPINWWEELVPSHVTMSKFPERRYSAKMGDSFQFNDGILLGYDTGFQPSSTDYLKNFMGMVVYHGRSHGDNGEMSIYLPDMRGRIIKNGKAVSIEGTDANACLVGEAASKASIKIKAPDTIELDETEFSQSELWLLTPDNEILDFRSMVESQYRISSDNYGRDVAERILGLVDKGENHELEYKPYIDISGKGNSKSSELEKTVCAFANGKGGILLIGVDDEGSIKGIDQDVLELYKTEIDTSIDTYIKNIKKRLREKLRYNQCFDVFGVKIGERHVIVVSVQRTEKPNYFVNTDMGYIRKGATSVKMKSADEREVVNPPSGLFGSY